MRRLSDITRTLLLLTALTGLVATANAAPYAGYVYPAGGKAGTTFEVSIGGQRLSRVQSARITGAGVELKFLEYIEPPLRTFRKARNARDKVLTEIEEKKAKGESVEGITVPKVPKRIRNPRAQPNAQIEETARVEITISRDAKPGKREIRLLDKRGISNPIIFHVGTLNEMS